MEESAVVTWWRGVLSLLHPVLLWHWFTAVYRNIKSGFDPRFRRRRRLLSWVGQTSGRDVADLASVWQDGTILCDLIHRSCPSACQGHEESNARNTFRHAQALAYRCLLLQPAFTEAELCRVELTPNIEKRLFRYLQSLRQAITRKQLNRSADEESEGEAQVAEEYIARGMGLIMASRNQRAIFYVYSRDGSSLMDIHIEIRGPGDDFGSILVTSNESFGNPTGASIPVEYRLTEEYLRVSYQPRSVGSHELSISRHGYNVPGSPFLVSVDEISEKVPKKRFNSVEWFTEDEERRQTELQEKKKNAKVKYRIVDFVTEKMYLTEDGKLLNFLPQNVPSIKPPPPDFPAPTPTPTPAADIPKLTPPSPTSSTDSKGNSNKKSRTLSPRPRRKRGERTKFMNIKKEQMNYILVKPQKAELKRVSDASAQVALEFQPSMFQERCKRIVTVCDYLLQHCPRQTSLEIISGAGSILQSFNSDQGQTESKVFKPKLSELDDDDDVFVPAVAPSPTTVRTIMYPERCRSVSLTHVRDGSKDTVQSSPKESIDSSFEKRKDSDSSIHLASEARRSFRREGNTKTPGRRTSFSSIHEISDSQLQSKSTTEDSYDLVTVTDDYIAYTEVRPSDTSIDEEPKLINYKPFSREQSSLELRLDGVTPGDDPASSENHKNSFCDGNNTSFQAVDEVNRSKFEYQLNEGGKTIKNTSDKINSPKGNQVGKIVARFETNLSLEQEKGCSPVHPTETVVEVEKSKARSTLEPLLTERTGSHSACIIERSDNIDSDKKLQIEYLTSIGAPLSTIKAKIQLFEKGLAGESCKNSSPSPKLETVIDPFNNQNKMTKDVPEHIFRAEPAMVVSKHYADLPEITVNKEPVKEGIIFDFQPKTCANTYSEHTSDEVEKQGEICEIKYKLDTWDPGIVKENTMEDINAPPQPTFVDHDKHTPPTNKYKPENLSGLKVGENCKIPEESRPSYDFNSYKNYVETESEPMDAQLLDLCSEKKLDAETIILNESSSFSAASHVFSDNSPDHPICTTTGDQIDDSKNSFQIEKSVTLKDDKSNENNIENEDTQSQGKIQLEDLLSCDELESNTTKQQEVLHTEMKLETKQETATLSEENEELIHSEKLIENLNEFEQNSTNQSGDDEQKVFTSNHEAITGDEHPNSTEINKKIKTEKGIDYYKSDSSTIDSRQYGKTQDEFGLEKEETLPENTSTIMENSETTVQEESFGRKSDVTSNCLNDTTRTSSVRPNESQIKPTVLLGSSQEAASEGCGLLEKTKISEVNDDKVADLKVSLKNETLEESGNAITESQQNKTTNQITVERENCQQTKIHTIVDANDATEKIHSSVFSVKAEADTIVKPLNEGCDPQDESKKYNIPVTGLTQKLVHIFENVYDQPKMNRVDNVLQSNAFTVENKINTVRLTTQKEPLNISSKLPVTSQRNIEKIEVKGLTKKLVKLFENIYEPALTENKASKTPGMLQNMSPKHKTDSSFSGLSKKMIKVFDDISDNRKTTISATPDVIVHAEKVDKQNIKKSVPCMKSTTNEDQTIDVLRTDTPKPVSEEIKQCLEPPSTEVTIIEKTGVVPKEEDHKPMNDENRVCLETKLIEDVDFTDSNGLGSKGTKTKRIIDDDIECSGTLTTDVQTTIKLTGVLPQQEESKPTNQENEASLEQSSTEDRSITELTMKGKIHEESNEILKDDEASSAAQMPAIVDLDSSLKRPSSKIIQDTKEITSASVLVSPVSETDYSSEQTENDTNLDIKKTLMKISIVCLAPVISDTVSTSATSAFHGNQTEPENIIHVKNENVEPAILDTERTIKKSAIVEKETGTKNIMNVSIKDVVPAVSDTGSTTEQPAIETKESGPENVRAVLNTESTIELHNIANKEKETDIAPALSDIKNTTEQPTKENEPESLPAISLTKSTTEHPVIETKEKSEPENVPVKSDINSSAEQCVIENKENKNDSVTDVLDNECTTEQPPIEPEESEPEIVPAVSDTESPHKTPAIEIKESEPEIVPAVSDTDSTTMQPAIETKESEPEIVTNVSDTESTTEQPAIEIKENEPEIVPAVSDTESTTEQPAIEIKESEPEIVPALSDTDSTTEQPAIEIKESEPEIVPPVSDTESTTEQPVIEIKESEPEIVRALSDTDSTTEQPAIEIKESEPEIVPAVSDTESTTEQPAIEIKESEPEIVSAVSDTDSTTKQPAIETKESESEIVPAVSDTDSTTEQPDTETKESEPEIVPAVLDTDSTTEQPAIETKKSELDIVPAVSDTDSTAEQPGIETKESEPEVVPAVSDADGTTEQPDIEIKQSEPEIVPAISDTDSTTEKPDIEIKPSEPEIVPAVSDTDSTNEQPGIETKQSEPEIVPAVSDTDSSTKRPGIETKESEPEVVPAVSDADGTTEQPDIETKQSEPEIVPAVSDTDSSTEQPGIETKESEPEVVPAVSDDEGTTEQHDIEIKQSEPEIVPAVSDTDSTTEQPDIEIKESEPKIVPAVSDTESTTEQPAIEIKEIEPEIVPNVSDTESTTEQLAIEIKENEPEIVPAVSDTESPTEQPAIEIKDSEPEIVPALSDTDSTTEQRAIEIKESESEIVPAVSDTDSTTEQPAIETKESELNIVPAVSDTDSTNEQPGIETKESEPEVVPAVSDADGTTEQPDIEIKQSEPEIVPAVSDTDSTTEQPGIETKQSEPEIVPAISDTDSSTEQPGIETKESEPEVVPAVSDADGTTEQPDIETKQSEPEIVPAVSDTDSSTEQPGIETKESEPEVVPAVSDAEGTTEQPDIEIKQSEPEIVPAVLDTDSTTEQPAIETKKSELDIVPAVSDTDSTAEQPGIETKESEPEVVPAVSDADGTTEQPDIEIKQSEPEIVPAVSDTDSTTEQPDIEIKESEPKIVPAVSVTDSTTMQPAIETKESEPEIVPNVSDTESTTEQLAIEIKENEPEIVPAVSDTESTTEQPVIEIKESEPEIVPPVSDTDSTTEQPAIEIKESEPEIVRALSDTDSTTEQPAIEIKENEPEIVPAVSDTDNTTEQPDIEMKQSEPEIVPAVSDTDSTTEQPGIETKQSEPEIVPAVSDTDSSTEQPGIETKGSEPEVVPAVSDAEGTTEQPDIEIKQSEPEIVPAVSDTDSTTEQPAIETNESEPEIVPAISNTDSTTEQPAFKTKESEAEIVPPVSDADITTDQPAIGPKESEPEIVPAVTDADITTDQPAIGPKENEPEIVPAVTDADINTDQPAIGPKENEPEIVPVVSDTDSTTEQHAIEIKESEPEIVPVVSDTDSTTEQPAIEIKESEPDFVPAVSDTDSTTEQFEIETKEIEPEIVPAVSNTYSTTELSAIETKESEPEIVPAVSDTDSTTEQPAIETKESEPEIVSAVSDTDSTTEQPAIETKGSEPEIVPAVSHTDSTTKQPAIETKESELVILPAVSDTDSNTEQPAIETKESEPVILPAVSDTDSATEPPAIETKETGLEILTAVSDKECTTEQPAFETKESEPEIVPAVSDAVSTTKQPGIETKDSEPEIVPAVSDTDGTTEQRGIETKEKDPEIVPAVWDTDSTTEQPAIEIKDSEPEIVSAVSDTDSTTEQPAIETNDSEPEIVPAESDTDSITEQPGIETKESEPEIVPTVSDTDSKSEQLEIKTKESEPEIVNAVSDTGSTTEQPAIEPKETGLEILIVVSDTDSPIKQPAIETKESVPEIVPAVSDTDSTTEQPAIETKGSEPEIVPAVSDTVSTTEQPAIETKESEHNILPAVSDTDSTTEQPSIEKNEGEPEIVIGVSDADSTTEQPAIETKGSEPEIVPAVSDTDSTTEQLEIETKESVPEIVPAVTDTVSTTEQTAIEIKEIEPDIVPVVLDTDSTTEQPAIEIIECEREIVPVVLDTESTTEQPAIEINESEPEIAPVVLDTDSTTELPAIETKENEPEIVPAITDTDITTEQPAIEIKKSEPEFLPAISDTDSTTEQPAIEINESEPEIVPVVLDTDSTTELPAIETKENEPEIVPAISDTDITTEQPAIEIKESEPEILPAISDTDSTTEQPAIEIKESEPEIVPGVLDTDGTTEQPAIEIKESELEIVPVVLDTDSTTEQPAIEIKENDPEIVPGVLDTDSTIEQPAIEILGSEPEIVPAVLDTDSTTELPPIETKESEPEIVPVVLDTDSTTEQPVIEIKECEPEIVPVVLDTYSTTEQPVIEINECEPEIVPAISDTDSTTEQPAIEIKESEPEIVPGVLDTDITTEQPSTDINETEIENVLDETKKTTRADDVNLAPVVSDSGSSIEEPVIEMKPEDTEKTISVGDADIAPAVADTGSSSEYSIIYKKPDGTEMTSIMDENLAPVLPDTESFSEQPVIETNPDDTEKIISVNVYTSASLVSDNLSSPEEVMPEVVTDVKKETLKVNVDLLVPTESENSSSSEEAVPRIAIEAEDNSKFNFDTLVPFVSENSSSPKNYILEIVTGKTEEISTVIDNLVSLVSDNSSSLYEAVPEPETGETKETSTVNVDPLMPSVSDNLSSPEEAICEIAATETTDIPKVNVDALVPPVSDNSSPLEDAVLEIATDETEDILKGNVDTLVPTVFDSTTSEEAAQEAEKDETKEILKVNVNASVPQAIIGIATSETTENSKVNLDPFVPPVSHNLSSLKDAVLEIVTDESQEILKVNFDTLISPVYDNLSPPEETIPEISTNGIKETSKVNVDTLWLPLSDTSSALEGAVTGVVNDNRKEIVKEEDCQVPPVLNTLYFHDVVRDNTEESIKVSDSPLLLVDTSSSSEKAVTDIAKDETKDMKVNDNSLVFPISHTSHFLEYPVEGLTKDDHELTESDNLNENKCETKESVQDRKDIFLGSTPEKTDIIIGVESNEHCSCKASESEDILNPSASNDGKTFPARDLYLQLIENINTQPEHILKQRREDDKSKINSVGPFNTPDSPGDVQTFEQDFKTETLGLSSKNVETGNDNSMFMNIVPPFKESHESFESKTSIASKIKQFIFPECDKYDVQNAEYFIPSDKRTAHLSLISYRETEDDLLGGSTSNTPEPLILSSAILNKRRSSGGNEPSVVDQLKRRFEFPYLNTDSNTEPKNNETFENATSTRKLGEESTNFSLSCNDSLENPVRYSERGRDSEVYCKSLNKEVRQVLSVDSEMLNNNLLTVEQELSEVLSIEDEEIDRNLEKEIHDIEAMDKSDVKSYQIHLLEEHNRNIIDELQGDICIENEKLDKDIQQQILEIDGMSYPGSGESSIESYPTMPTSNKKRIIHIDSSLLSFDPMDDETSSLEDENVHEDIITGKTKVESTLFNTDRENEPVLSAESGHTRTLLRAVDLISDESNICEEELDEETQRALDEVECPKTSPYVDTLIDEKIEISHSAIGFYSDFDTLNRSLSPCPLDNANNSKDCANEIISPDYSFTDLCSYNNENDEAFVEDSMDDYRVVEDMANANSPDNIVLEHDMNNYAFFNPTASDVNLNFKIDSGKRDYKNETNDLSTEAMLSSLQSETTGAGESFSDSLPEFKDMHLSLSTESDSSEFHMWSSNVEFGEPGDASVAPEGMDFDSIISAPNLDEALRKLERHIQDKGENFQWLTTRTPSPSLQSLEKYFKDGVTNFDSDEFHDPISKEANSDSASNTGDYIVNENEDDTGKTDIWATPCENLPACTYVQGFSEADNLEQQNQEQQPQDWIISPYQYPRVLFSNTTQMSIISEEDDSRKSEPTSPLQKNCVSLNTDDKHLSSGIIYSTDDITNQSYSPLEHTESSQQPSDSLTDKSLDKDSDLNTLNEGDEFTETTSDGKKHELINMKICLINSMSGGSTVTSNESSELTINLENALNSREQDIAHTVAGINEEKGSTVENAEKSDADRFQASLKENRSVQQESLYVDNSQDFQLDCKDPQLTSETSKTDCDKDIKENNENYVSKNDPLNVPFTFTKDKKIRDNIKYLLENSIDSVTEEMVNEFSVSERKLYWDTKLKKIQELENQNAISCGPKSLSKIKSGTVSKLVSCFGQTNENDSGLPGLVKQTNIHPKTSCQTTWKQIANQNAEESKLERKETIINKTEPQVESSDVRSIDTETTVETTASMKLVSHWKTYWDDMINEKTEINRTTQPRVVHKIPSIQISEDDESGGTIILYDDSNPSNSCNKDITGSVSIDGIGISLDSSRKFDGESSSNSFQPDGSENESCAKILTQEVSCENVRSREELSIPGMSRPRSYSAGNIDKEFLTVRDTKSSDVEDTSDRKLKILENEESTQSQNEFKMRFERAKQFFKHLEQLGPGDVKGRDYRSMPKMDSNIKTRRTSVDSDSGPDIKPRKVRDHVKGRKRRRKKEKGSCKIQSAPTSDTETSKRVQRQESCDSFGGSVKIRKVSERFHVKDLFRDVSDSDGFFRGIPNRAAVLASLRSVDDVRAISPYEVDYGSVKSTSLGNIPSGFQEEYPYLPTTPIQAFRPRSALGLNLIPRRDLLDEKF